MSAREFLLASWPSLRLMNEDNRKMVENGVDAVLAMHAHELAEKIRARAERIVGVGPYSLGIMAVLNEALESIDPKKESQ